MLHKEFDQNNYNYFTDKAENVEMLMSDTRRTKTDETSYKSPDWSIKEYFIIKSKKNIFLLVMSYGVSTA